jgi:dTMP kinase
MNNLFISIEGTEGAGKSTALQFIHDYFEKKKYSVILTREPGGTEIAEQIRQLLLHTHSNEKVQPETELLLMFAARAQHIAEVIKPALEANQVVITDRYVDASYAYQSGGRGLERGIVAALDHIIVKEVYPALTILLDIPPEQGMERAESRGHAKDRIEKERMDFFARVREAYLERAQADPDRIKIVDASQSVANVQTQLLAVLDQFMRNIST